MKVTTTIKYELDERDKQKLESLLKNLDPNVDMSDFIEKDIISFIETLMNTVANNEASNVK